MKMKMQKDFWCLYHLKVFLNHRNQGKEIKPILLKKESFYINNTLKDFAKNDRCIVSTKQS